MTTQDTLVEREFCFAAPDFVDVEAVINWSKPYPYEVLFTGHADEDETAHFYAIIAYEDKDWWTYYFGMVYDQCISDRQKQPDHRRRLEMLQKDNPKRNFRITLGVLSLPHGNLNNRKLTQAIEGLLIYANWHEDLINLKKVENFACKKSIFIRNIGFIEHLDAEEVAYGVFCRSNA